MPKGSKKGAAAAAKQAKKGGGLNPHKTVLPPKAGGEKSVVAQNILWRDRIKTEMNGGDQWVRQWGVLYDCAATSLPLEIAKKKDELAALEAEIAAAEGVQAAACQRVVARQN